MKRQPIIAGNWKMNGTQAQAQALAEAVVTALGQETERQVLLCPPFVHLETVRQATKNSHVLLGSQNLYWETEGAFTGEISAGMLLDLGCTYCILGHSERRHVLGETDSEIRQKLDAALEKNLKIILCVGETIEQRRANQTTRVIEQQLKTALDSVDAARLASDLVIAYEPVWAIGTGETATPEQAQEVHLFIRSWLSEKFGATHAERTRIQYGGSVKPNNAAELMAQPDVDGALVGGASLKAKDFIAIVQAAHTKETSCSTG